MAFHEILFHQLWCFDSPAYNVQSMNIQLSISHKWNEKQNLFQLYEEIWTFQIVYDNPYFMYFLLFISYLTWLSFKCEYLKAFASIFVAIFPIQFLMFFATVENVFTTATFQSCQYSTKCTFWCHRDYENFK